MKKNFKPGDRVVCIDSDYLLGMRDFPHFTKNSIYVVKDIDSDYVYLLECNLPDCPNKNDGHCGGWYRSRFRLADDPCKLKNPTKKDIEGAVPLPTPDVMRDFFGLK